MATVGAEPSRPGVVQGADLLVAGLFLVYAGVFFLGRWQGFHPFVFLGGDAGNIASYAAALDHPRHFAGDGALGDPSEFDFYLTLHIPLLRLLGRWLGDYGSAFASLLAPHVWLQGLGFYVLGRVLFGSRFWAFLLAVANLAPVSVGLGTYWGTHSDPQPRFAFQALLPFLLALAVAWSRRPRRWPWLLLGAGALTYVHPVSAPGWGFALWLGLWCRHPDGWSLRRRLAGMLGVGAVFLLASAPFALRYLGSREHGVPATLDFDVVYPILTRWLPPAYFDVKRALVEFATHLGRPGALLAAGALCGAGALLALRGRGREMLPLLGLWAAGLAFVSVALPWADQAHTAARRALPLQIDLIRGLRYFVPLALLLALWPLAELHARLRQRGRPAAGALAVALAGALLTAAWVASHPPPQPLAALECWKRGRVTCPPVDWGLTLEAVEAVHTRTPVGARLIATSQELPVRYHALRPVVHARRDIGVLLYSKHEDLPAWDAFLQRRVAIRGLRDRALRFEAYAALAADVGADYALLGLCCVPDSFRAGREHRGHRVVWRNPGYALVRIGGGASAAPAAGAPCAPASGCVPGVDLVTRCGEWSPPQTPPGGATRSCRSSPPSSTKRDASRSS